MIERAIGKVSVKWEENCPQNPARNPVPPGYDVLFPEGGCKRTTTARNDFVVSHNAMKRFIEAIALVNSV